MFKFIMSDEIEPGEHLCDGHLQEVPKAFNPVHQHILKKGKALQKESGIVMLRRMCKDYFHVVMSLTHMMSDIFLTKSYLLFRRRRIKQHQVRTRNEPNT